MGLASIDRFELMSFVHLPVLAGTPTPSTLPSTTPTTISTTTPTVPKYCKVDGTKYKVCTLLLCITLFKSFIDRVGRGSGRCPLIQKLKFASLYYMLYILYILHDNS